MKDYLHFQPEDFAQDDFFIQWVKSTSITAETFWQNWLETYPFKRNDVEAARQLVLLTQNLPEPDISDSEINLLKDAIFKTIETTENGKRRIWPLIPTWVAAAVVTGILCFAGWYALNNKSHSKPPYARMVTKAAETYDLVEVKNATRATRLINLPDGSSVILKKGSKLSYPSHFGKNSREIYLTGEAFFEVFKDAERPFYVYANEIVTKVLGTSFNVRAYHDDQEISVTVKTGKVSVYKAGSPESEAQSQSKLLKGMILSSNQRAVFVKEKTVFVKTRVEPEVIVPAIQDIEQMLFEYDETALGEIFSQLERAYNIHILYDRTVMEHCPVTASLTGEPLNEKLNLLCKAVRAHYEIIDGEIVISGKGCE